MLSVRGLSKTYITKQGRIEALKNINFDVDKGEIFGLIGLSGAGKTSLVRCISMLEKADGGEVVLNGVNLTGLKSVRLREARKKLGMVFQHFHLLMNSTVFENVAFPLRIAKMPNTLINAKVSEMLELVGLTDKRDAYPSMLSGGQKQRVGIARALAAEPELVICDEATSALDPETTKSILELIKRINKKTGVTFIVITHEMDVIKALCHRVAVMEDGEIIEQGRVIDVLAAPKTGTAKRFLTKNDGFDISRFKEGLSRGDIILKALFVGENAGKPFISNIIRKFDVELSILSGGIESVGGIMTGELVIKMSGGGEAMASSIQYFKEAGVGIEVIHNASL